MKILKIFGVVVGIHVFALILIFANPGCSSTNPPASSDTVAKSDSAPSAAVPPPATGDISPVTIAGAGTTPPPSFDPNAPATSSSSAAVRFSPTRPNTAAASTLEAEPVADVTPATTYTVTKGDSLWTIAKKHHLTVTELASANNIKPGATVHLGQKLIIPSKALPAGTSAGHNAVDKAAAKSSAASTAPVADSSVHRSGSGEIRHVVKPGETLGGIAHKYHVKRGEIEVANNITDPRKIRPGMELVIPGGQASTSAGATSAKSATSTAAPASLAPTDSPLSAAPDQDAGAKTQPVEPPVIKIDDSSTPPKQ